MARFPFLQLGILCRSPYVGLRRGSEPIRLTSLVVLCFVFFGSGVRLFAQTSTAAIGVVRHPFDLTGSNRIEGSLQILTPEVMTLGGNATVTADLLVPGTPTVQFEGNPRYGGTIQGSGSTSPSNYTVAGNGSFSLRHVIVRSNAVSLPAVPPPPQPIGTRSVTLSNPGDNAGDFSTIRNLAVDGKAGNVNVPPGTYGNFSVSGKNSLTLGLAGGTRPVAYNFQQLTFTGNDDLRIIG